MHLHITLARAGTLVFTALLTITLLTAERTAANAATATAPRASAATSTSAATGADLLTVPTLSAPEVAVLGAETAPETVTEPEPAAPPVLVAPPPPAASDGSYVLASWYGPGFYGNRTACGQTYSAQIMATRASLGCPDLCTLLMQYAR